MHFARLQPWVKGRVVWRAENPENCFVIFSPGEVLSRAVLQARCQVPRGTGGTARRAEDGHFSNRMQQVVSAPNCWAAAVAARLRHVDAISGVAGESRPRSGASALFQSPQ